MIHLEKVEVKCAVTEENKEKLKSFLCRTLELGPVQWTGDEIKVDRVSLGRRDFFQINIEALPDSSGYSFFAQIYNHEMVFLNPYSLLFSGLQILIIVILWIILKKGSIIPFLFWGVVLFLLGLIFEINVKTYREDKLKNYLKKALDQFVIDFYLA